MRPTRRRTRDDAFVAPRSILAPAISGRPRIVPPAAA
jgi:hypothetical protein